MFWHKTLFCALFGRLLYTLHLSSSKWLFSRGQELRGGINNQLLIVKKINIGWPSVKSMSQMRSYAGITLCIANSKYLTLFTEPQLRLLTHTYIYVLVLFHSNMPPTLTITHSNYSCCRSESSGAYASFID